MPQEIVWEPVAERPYRSSWPRRAAIVGVTAGLLATLGNIGWHHLAPTRTPAIASATQIRRAHQPLPAARPIRVILPSIKVEAPLVALGTHPNGVVEDPPLDTPYVAGWFRGGPTPGEDGNAVLLGHRDARNRVAIFFYLNKLKARDRIEVRRADGTTAIFAVDSVETFRKSSFPTERVYGRSGGPGLRLVTCAGTFDRKRQSYRDNLIVFASLVGAR